MLIFLDFQENRPECSSDIYAQRYKVNIPKVEIFASKSFLRVSLPLREKASNTLLAKLGYLYFMVSLKVAPEERFSGRTIFLIFLRAIIKNANRNHLYFNKKIPISSILNKVEAYLSQWNTYIDSSFITLSNITAHKPNWRSNYCRNFHLYLAVTPIRWSWSTLPLSQNQYLCCRPPVLSGHL